MQKIKAAIPQMITLGGVYFGFLAMCWAGTDAYRACLCIVLAGVCDMVDGRVARLLGTQSEFGAQLDSLADIVSFGLAPAFLAYQWALSDLGEGVVSLGGTLAFVFVACGAIRLARFNVASDAEDVPKDHFLGVPIPIAALLLTCLIMTSHELALPELQSIPVVSAVLVIAALLMVSRIPFPSYKRFERRVSKYAFYGSVVGGLTLLAVGGPGGTVLLSLLTLYVVVGLIKALFGAASN